MREHIPQTLIDAIVDHPAMEWSIEHCRCSICIEEGIRAVKRNHRGDSIVDKINSFSEDYLITTLHKEIHSD